LGSFNTWESYQPWTKEYLKPNKGDLCGKRSSLTKIKSYGCDSSRQSKGQLTYIGEWHTHPEKLPRPSSADTGMLSDILAGSKPPPLFLFGLILGTEGTVCLCYHSLFP
jgi:integrative and conjugative element protein (TIGR02256 family)